MAGLVEQEANDVKKPLVSSSVGGLRIGDFDELVLVDKVEEDDKGDDEKDCGG